MEPFSRIDLDMNAFRMYGRKVLERITYNELPERG